MGKRNPAHFARREREQKPHPARRQTRYAKQNATHPVDHQRPANQQIAARQHLNAHNAHPQTSRQSCAPDGANRGTPLMRNAFTPTTTGRRTSLGLMGTAAQSRSDERGRGRFPARGCCRWPLRPQPRAPDTAPFHSTRRLRIPLSQRNAPKQNALQVASPCHEPSQRQLPAPKTKGHHARCASMWRFVLNEVSLGESDGSWLDTG